MHSLYILDINPFSDIAFADLFYSICFCPFCRSPFFVDGFLRRAETLWFDVVLLFIFACVPFALKGVSHITPLILSTLEEDTINFTLHLRKVNGLSIVMRQGWVKFNPRASDTR